MPPKDLKSIVDRIVDLPTLPQVVTKIMALIEDPNSSAKSINDVMSNDPALAGKILKLVNSAFYALPNRVTSIQQAITILGFNTIKSLAISASVFDLFGFGEDAFSYESFWAHSVGCATASGYLARRSGFDADVTFVVGLLHGMGKLVLDQYAPVEFQDIIGLARKSATTFSKSEGEVIATTQAEIGYWLACKWKLAENVQLAILHQDNLETAPDTVKVYVAVQQISDYACRKSGLEKPGDFDTPTIPTEALSLIGIDEADLPDELAHISKELERAASFLSVVRS